MGQQKTSPDTIKSNTVPSRHISVRLHQIICLGYIPLFRHPLFRHTLFRHPLFWHLCVVR